MGYCNTTHKRSKRIVGAYVTVGAALGLASASMGLATSNKIQIENMRELQENSKRIEAVEQELLLMNNRQKVLMDTTTEIMGYVTNLTESVESIRLTVDCLAKTITMERWAVHQDKALADLLQFVLKGQIIGRLTPSLIKPDLLKKCIINNPHIDTNVLSEFPNILYQTATANLIKANFKDLQFSFLLSFPRFGQNPTYPFFSVTQLGFRAKLPSDFTSNGNKTTCLRFVMPVIVHVLCIRTNCTSCMQHFNVHYMGM